MTSATDRITVMSALAVRAAFDRSIVPAFERATGLRAEIVWDPTTVLMERVSQGERADVIVAIDEAMDRLVAERVVRPETRIEIAQAVIGLAVREGADKPDISTVEAFKHAVVGARSVAYSRGGASGIHFGGVIRRLGIADAVNARATVIPAGFTAEKLTTGEADLAVQQISELIVVPGIEVAGPLPAELQKATNFSAAMFTDAANIDGAARFLAALTSEAAGAAYRDSGLVPLPNQIR